MCREETQIEAGSQLAGAGVSPAVFLSKSPDKIEKGYRYGSCAGTCVCFAGTIQLHS